MNMSEKRKWRRGTFDISLTQSGRSQVYGYVSEPWGIDRRKTRVGSVWIITHLPTGYNIPHGAPTLKASKAAVTILDEWQIGWTKKRQFGMIPTKRSSFIRAVFDAADNDRRWERYLTRPLRT